jgi:hypothetical protein
MKYVILVACVLCVYVALSVGKLSIASQYGGQEVPAALLVYSWLVISGVFLSAFFFQILKFVNVALDLESPWQQMMLGLYCNSDGVSLP